MTGITDKTSKYFELLQLWDASYEEYAKSVGLSYTSLSVLSGIVSFADCTQKKLCEKCFLPKQTVNAVISSYLKKGWIRLEEDANDRRNKFIRLTEQGKCESEKIMRNIKNSEKKAMLSLTEDERELLIKITERYINECRDSLKNS